MWRYVIPAGVGVLYLIQGIYHFYKAEWGFGLMWSAYALANAGILIAMMEGPNE